VAGVLTGHLSTAYSSEYIAARSLSGIFLMLTGFTVNIAIGAAMDTLCAQAYGAGKLHEMGIFFQTGLLLFTLCFVPVALLGYFCVDLLVLLGQRRDIAVLARSLVLYALPALPFHMVNALLSKILQGQNLIAPMVYAGLVGNVVHAVLIYVLMFHTSVGFVGSSIASSALVVCYTGTLCTYFYRSHLYQREWPGWRLADALALVPEFLRLGLAGLGMAMFEYWAFSTVALVAGMLPWADVAISADSTYSSFRYLCGLLYGTIAVAGSVRVGNALGANDPQRAKLAAFLSVAVSVALALATSLAMLVLKDVYPYAYTSDADVVSLTSQLMLLTCGFQVFAGVSVAGQGILRGSGMQALGARINFVSYLVVGLPTGLVLAYQCGLGLLGLWLGLCAGFVCSGSYCVFWLLHANWIEMAEDAQKRTREPSDRSPEQASWLC
jgi:multidrug resistance protein, MATE family